MKQHTAYRKLEIIKIKPTNYMPETVKRKTIFAPVLAAVMALAAVMSACHRQQQATADEESELYDKVMTLGAEGLYKEAISAADSILQLNIGDSLRAYIMLERMVAFGNMGEPDRAMAYADDVADFSRKHKVSEVTINALASKGVLYRRANKTDSALMFYREALDIAISEKNLEYEQYVSDLLSILYTETLRSDEALRFSQRSLDIAVGMKDTTAMVSAIATIGAIYMAKGEYRKALDLEMPYMEMAEKMTAGGYLVKFLTPVIKAYLALDKTDSVRHYMAIVEPFVAQLPENHQTAVVMLNAKAELLGKEKRYREQLDIYNRIDSLGTHGKKEYLLLSERAACYDKLGDSHTAYTMMRRAYDVIDSIRKSEVEDDMSELSVKYGTLQKELEIERLGKERLAWIAVSAILAILIISVVIVLRYKCEKFRQKTELEKKMVYIRGLESERERIAKELHDGICNEMAAMTFALANDERALEQINAITAKTRRLSHELMPPQFKDGNLCQLLANYVMMMNGSHPETSITITDEGCHDWTTLPAEHSFELYRMVQESVGNALRHAAPSYIAITLDGDTANYSLTVENDGVRSGNGSDRTHDMGIGTQTLRARAGNIEATISTETDGQIYRITVKH